jgi:hypothetical protein
MFQATAHAFIKASEHGTLTIGELVFDPDLDTLVYRPAEPIELQGTQGSIHQMVFIGGYEVAPSFLYDLLAGRKAVLSDIISIFSRLKLMTPPHSLPAVVMNVREQKSHLFMLPERIPLAQLSCRFGTASNASGTLEVADYDEFVKEVLQSDSHS